MDQLNRLLLKFVDQWTAHNHQLNAFGQVFHNRFIVIILDEMNSSLASGCSIDSQVNFIRELGENLEVDFFDRLHFDFLLDGEVVSFHKDEVGQHLESGILQKSTLVFDHLIKTKAEFEKTWQKELSKSWHSRLI